MIKSSLHIDSTIELPIVEEFYSLQGEGVQTGKAAYFLRIGGCNVGCHFCDVKESWDGTKHQVTLLDDIVERISTNPSKAVVVTGGEPLLYNLDLFCEKLKANNVATYLETSGSEKLSGSWDWICVSPKRNHPPMLEVLEQADELKVVICEPEDLLWAEENALKVPKKCRLLLQPEWSVMDEVCEKVVNYILENPKWRMSLQSHKFINIP